MDASCVVATAGELPMYRACSRSPNGCLMCCGDSRRAAYVQSVLQEPEWMPRVVATAGELPLYRACSRSPNGCLVLWRQQESCLCTERAPGARMDASCCGDSRRAASVQSVLQEPEWMPRVVATAGELPLYRACSRSPNGCLVLWRQQESCLCTEYAPGARMDASCCGDSRRAASVQSMLQEPEWMPRVVATAGELPLYRACSRSPNGCLVLWRQQESCLCTERAASLALGSLSGTDRLLGCARSAMKGMRHGARWLRAGPQPLSLSLPTQAC